ncbi:hypothetical protein N5F13_02640 [Comamonas thiooxydans]|uniref:hypothetical protein n=1 Tax=Comamonas thiooxydans TaxID=363952 RepID=UPI0024482A99|nr:hypothetical protein [Comamonas thiooxydans]MDH1473377.1 hypothetical protein [Comamonas thiooxydans]
MDKKSNSSETPVKAWNAVAEWYHALFTGIVLYTVSRKGSDKATELVYEIFCRQRREKFLPGLQKLGIDKLPHAVAAAQYHYLSNHIGGVSVEFMPEANNKAWIRYAAPRWIWSGTALCGIPPDVSRAMLLGWHSQNGTMLQNPRLGFVCTKQTVDGQSGLEGYYYEYDHDLEPHERLRFAREQDAPDFDPALAPQLPIDTWPEARLAKAHRNYAMEYVRSAFPTAFQLWGPDEAAQSLQLASRMVGMQFYHQTAEGLGGSYGQSAEGFAWFMKDLAAAHGDDVSVSQTDDGYIVEQKSWAFLAGIKETDPQMARAWNGLIEGAHYAHNRRLKVAFEASSDRDMPVLRWHISE